MPKNDTVERLDDEIRTEHLGFTPSSNSTKPLYIANGLFREASGEVCDYHDIHEWILSERKKDAVSSERIIEKYKDILWQGEKENPAKIKQIRFLLDDVFNPDCTVYPKYDFSVINISSHWLVKQSVSAEARIGRFIFEILSKKIEGKRSSAIELIQKSLSEDSDDLTKLLKPIIVFPSEDNKRTVKGVNYPLDEEIRWDECKSTIRRGFDNLTESMIETGDSKNSILVLERMVNYACFATFYYLTNVFAAKYDGVRPPLLIDAGDELESIKKASEQCYSFAKTAVEDYYIAVIDDILQREIPQNNKEACQEWMRQMIFSDDSREKDISDALKNYFESFCEDGDSAIHALAHALQIILYTFDYKNNSPSDFCRVLGVRGGFIGPRGNRANVKRYLTNSFTLETITYSILSKEDINNGIELKEFCQKATDAYNLLLGADIDSEYTILEKVNIAQNTPGDLRGDMALNSQRIADLFISLGMAHRYADGVTIIGGGR